MTSKFFLVILFGVLIVGCCSLFPTPQDQVVPYTNICNDKPCFISAANDCNKTNITVNEDYGTVRYETTTDCMFTKTMLKLNSNENQEMKNLLEGKNFTCVYEKSKFDSKLVNSLLGGLENCSGELKNDLVKLVVFS